MIGAEQIARALGRPTPTPEQTAVIEAPLEPLLVVAGAGSGKTDTMASRVVWLVVNGLVRPQEILGLTFTRKAAGELAERVGQRLRMAEHSGLWAAPIDEDGTLGLGEAPTISTYNAYAGRIVSEHGLRLGIEPDARMLSEAAAWQFAHEVVASWDGDMSDIAVSESTVTAAVLAAAGELGEHLRSTGDLRDFHAAVLDELAHLPHPKRRRALGDGGKALQGKARGQLQLLPLVDRYRQLKRERSALDFSDQIGFAAELALRHPRIGAGERMRFRVVLLDEFQDTSEAQIAFLSGIFARGDDRPAVTAVGDPHQSIFGWRGASSTTLAKFRTAFALPGQGATPVAALSTSWRNDEAILAAANLTAEPLNIALDQGRGSSLARVPVKQLSPRPGADAGHVVAARLATADDEAAFVADWIAEQRQGGNKTAAVLCRKRSQFVPMLEAFAARGIPAEAVGLGGLLQTPEVVDLVSLLWVVDNPGRGDHLMRLISGPAMRLGAADIEALGAWATELHRRQEEELPDRAAADLAAATRDEVSIVEALDNLPDADWRGRDGQRVSAVALTRLTGLARSLERLRRLTGLPLADFVGEAERVLGLDIEVLARPGYEPATARAHLDAFADIAGTFSIQSERPTLGGFLDWLDAARSEERGLEMPAIEVNPGAVQILTVHAAKGLEWDVVAVPGLVEGSFPSFAGRSTEQGQEWVYKPNVAKGWLTGLAAIPYDMRGDRDGLPEFAWRGCEDSGELEERYETYCDEGFNHAVLEERRLGYVAFTRAREAMLLSAPIWYPESTKPRPTSSFLSELIDAGLAHVVQWEPMPATRVEGELPLNPLAADAAASAWPVDGMAAIREQLRDGADLVVTARTELAGRAHEAIVRQPLLPLEGTVEDRDLEVALLLAERDQNRRGPRRSVTLPAHLSASDVVALASDPKLFARRLRRPMPSEPAVAARRGTAFHAWVEKHYNAAALVDVDSLPGFADEDPAPDDVLPQLQANFLASEWATRAPVDIEVSVETVIEGYAVRGRIDAVFAREDGGFTVVDWKTGAKPSDEVLAYRSLQLAAYALAYARLRGVPATMVDSAFFYAASGQTVWRAGNEEEQLISLLRAATAGEVVDENG